MEISTQNIRNWLEAPHTFPDKSAIDASLKAWPWFIPLRLMEASSLHQAQAFSPKTLALLDLYATNGVFVHQLLSHSTTEPMNATITTIGDVYPEPSTIQTPELQPQKPAITEESEPLIQPLFTEDYFRHQGIAPTATEPEILAPEPTPKEDPRTLMVMMSFAEWLSHFKVKSQREQEEEREKSALRSMWQQEKLAAALGEETEEIPEDVFEMAVTSITREDDIASEPLARILEKQEKWAAAAEMYRKLGLRNPTKSSYFASRAEAAKKRLQ